MQAQTKKIVIATSIIGAIVVVGIAMILRSKRKKLQKKIWGDDMCNERHDSDKHKEVREDSIYKFPCVRSTLIHPINNKWDENGDRDD